MFRSPLTRLLRGVALVAALALALPLTADAAPKEKAKGKGDAAAAEKPDKPFTEWKKVTKDAEQVKGFLTLYKKRENLYLEVPTTMIGKPFLGVFSLARGIGSNFVLGGLPINDRLLQFERAGDHLLLVELNTRFTAPAGSPMDQARDLSLGNSVIASLKIESEHDTTKAVLVDFAPVLVSDFTDMAEGMRGAFNKSVRFDKDRSALGSLKNFPENTEIEALLTYSPNDRMGLSLPTVPDERYIAVTVHYSFSKLPDVPMQPRVADPRVGYFLTAMKDFGRDDQENFWMRYVNRWRLEKKDPTAALSEPVKPIVYYVDRTVPDKYRPWVKEGIEKWQKAFEAAGFKNAIIAKDPPDDPNWDPEDVRYSSIRWITSSDPSFGAIGPSRVDPRTGEVLDADVLVEASMLQNYRNNYRRFGGPEDLAKCVLPSVGDGPANLPMEMRCNAQIGVQDAGALQHIALLMDGFLPAGAPVPDEYMHDMLVWTVMHEVGHQLTLRHNFRSSTSTPMDKLNDKTWTLANGVTSSVMEYPTVNISSDRSKQGQWWPSSIGTYDVWAIRYGYTPTGETDVQKDYAAIRKVADESMMPGHEYSTDDDTYPADALDPRSNIYDLSNDPLEFARQRTAYISSLWKRPSFEEKIVGPSGEYPTLRRAMDTLLGQYGQSLGFAVKFVGGSYMTRNFRGQPEAKDPLTPVAAAKQREAVDFLGARAFAADVFTVNPGILNAMAADRWSHWGMASSFGQGARVDYALHDKALAIQTVLVNGLTAPALLSRLREQESRSSDAYRLSEHFDKLTRTLWGEVGGTSPAAFRALEGPNTRRDLQRVYVDRLAGMVVAAQPQGPDDARALARLQLTRIDARCARVLAAGTTLGDYTRAHLLETRARVKRAIEAGADADPQRAPAVTAAPATTN